jgi:CheY-like chemotaxis protein
MKYLVVDDSKLARLGLIKSLKEHVGEAEIFQATNGEEAIEIVKNEKPSVVFLDLTMPIMDGYEALPIIKELHPDSKVVVVSADVQAQAKTKVLALGARLHIQKPISSSKMQNILKML